MVERLFGQSLYHPSESWDPEMEAWIPTSAGMVSCCARPGKPLIYIQMNESEKTRQERREEKLRKKKERMAKHGGSLVKIYKDAILKRLKRKPE